MAAPNIGAPTTINGKTAHLNLTNLAQDLIAAVTTGHCIRVKHIICANTTAAAHPVTVFHKAGGTSYALAQTLSVPGNSSVVLDGVYLEEGDSITSFSDAASQITVNAPYEDIS
jgi:hypothetical protein